MIELLIIAFLLVCLFLLLGYHKYDPPSRITSIMVVYGNKQLIATDRDLAGLYIENGGKKRELRSGMDVRDGDEVVTDEKTTITITLQGNQLLLNPSSRVIIQRKGKDVIQVAGEVLYLIRNGPFSSFMKIGTATTRTTKFIISISTNETIKLVAIEGSINLSSIAYQDRSIVVNEGEYGKIDEYQNIWKDKIFKEEFRKSCLKFSNIPLEKTGCNRLKGYFYEYTAYKNAMIIYKQQKNFHESFGKSYTYDVDKLVKSIPQGMTIEVIHADFHSFIAQICYKGCSWLVDSERTFIKM